MSLWLVVEMCQSDAAGVTRGLPPSTYARPERGKTAHGESRSELGCRGVVDPRHVFELVRDLEAWRCGMQGIRGKLTREYRRKKRFGRCIGGRG
jgi:hypothetical protein